MAIFGVNFRGKYLFQAIKQHLNGEKLDVVYVPAFGWAVLFCLGDWKNVS